MERRAHGEGLIRLRPDGRWEAQIRLELPSGHKRFSVYGKTRGQVSRKIAEVRQKHEVEQQELTKSPPLRDYLNDWWPTGYDIKSTTYLARELNCRRISAVLGSVPLDEVSIRHIKLLDKTLRESGGQMGQGLSPSSRKQALAILRTALASAHAEDRIARNPFSKWRREDTPRSRHRPKRVLTLAEKATLFSLNDEWTPIWKIQLATGSRIGETLALTWPDLELPEEAKNGLLHITKSIHRRKINSQLNADWLGHGEKYYLDKPKTKTSTRDVVLTPFMVQIFKDVRVSQEAEAKRIGASWSNPKGFVFTRGKGEPITPDVAWDGMQTTAKKVGIAGTVRVHDLRHTMITDQILAGTSLEKVSKMVGHSSMTFTADVYGHLTKGMSTEVSESASRIIEQAMRFAEAPELQGVPNG